MKKINGSSKTTESIDCVALKNEIQSKTYDDIKGMTLAQENEYREKNIESSSLSDMWKKLKTKTKKEKKARYHVDYNIKM